MSTFKASMKHKFKFLIKINYWDQSAFSSWRNPRTPTPK